VVVAAPVGVFPDDQAGVVDAGGKGTPGAKGIVEGGVGAAAVEEAVVAGGAVPVIPDDLARVVDAQRKGAGAPGHAGQGIIEGGVGATAVEKAVGDQVAVLVTPNNLPRIVDTGWSGKAAGKFNGSVTPPAEKEAYPLCVPPDDLASVVDAGCGGAAALRSIEGGVGATAIEEAVVAVITGVIPNDLA
jgi:hypothetical protein